VVCVRFPVEELDELVREDSASLDPPLRHIWGSFRRREAWLRPSPELLLEGEGLIKRYYVQSTQGGSDASSPNPSPARSAGTEEAGGAIEDPSCWGATEEA
jgi:hypothetical protein